MKKLTDRTGVPLEPKQLIMVSDHGVLRCYIIKEIKNTIRCFPVNKYGYELARKLLLGESVMKKRLDGTMYPSDIRISFFSILEHRSKFQVIPISLLSHDEFIYYSRIIKCFD